MLQGVLRDSIAKQSTKQLRRDGYLIANIYGKGIKNVNAAFKINDYIRALKSKETIAFDVEVGGNIFKVVVQEYQRDPITSQPIHVDLMVAQPGLKTTYLVPVKTTGTPKGLKNKGMLFFHRKRIAVKCTIENLPENFTFDVTDLDTGDNFLVRDIKLPEGVDCFLDPRVPVVGVIKAK
ncbi:MAG: 50S ribosomal protein L25/general stress protein Ctc [Campylobacterales bacterium]|nr:50S ribosomal protein L25/general stress protein Ctc [Campylobacterales bacterium]